MVENWSSDDPVTGKPSGISKWDFLTSLPRVHLASRFGMADALADHDLITQRVSYGFHDHLVKGVVLDTTPLAGFQI
jgi:hypothetical protein